MRHHLPPAHTPSLPVSQSKETCGTFQHIKKSLATIVCVCIMVHSCFVSFSADSLSSSDTNYKPATRRLADSKLNWQCWTGSGSIIIFFLFHCRLMIHFDVVMRVTTKVTEVSQSVSQAARFISYFGLVSSCFLHCGGTVKYHSSILKPTSRVAAAG